MSFDFKTLKEINEKVNQLPYKAQIGDDWDPYTKNGFDCNSYASRKAEELSMLGVPRESMRFATAYVPGYPEGNNYHSLLTVRLGETDYVLDNRFPHPMEVGLLNYKWDKIMVHDPDGGTHWEKIK